MTQESPGKAAVYPAFAGNRSSAPEGRGKGVVHVDSTMRQHGVIYS